MVIFGYIYINRKYMSLKDIKEDIKTFTYHLFEILMVTFNNEKDVDIKKFIGGYFDFMIKGGLIGDLKIDELKNGWKVSFIKKYVGFDAYFEVTFNNEEIINISITSDNFSLHKRNINYGEDGYEKFNRFLGEIKIILDTNLS